jgi:hypothetical protein
VAADFGENKKMKESLIIGCNYHTTWQSKPGMRFVLVELSSDGLQAKLVTRNTHRSFWTKSEDLIFIMSKFNIEKAKKE